MAEKLAKFFIGIFGGITAVWWGKYLVMFIISLMPILELRGGLIAASLMDAPMWTSFLVCFIGNILPIPFILWFITRIFDFLKKRNGKLGKIVVKLEQKANSKKDQIERLKYLGLVLFVGIPLPGTGAWMGSLIANFLDLPAKKAVPVIILGVFTAGVIMLALTAVANGGLNYIFTRV